MAGRRRRETWTSNEYFAYKKNVGEDVKLKYKMVTIERRYGFVKDSMKHTFCEARNSLKNLRKSTGHSIEALPPTPFQSHHNRSSVPSLPLPAIVPPSDDLPPEYRYLENDVESPSGIVFVDNSGTDVVFPKISEAYAVSVNDNVQTDDQDLQNTHNSDNDQAYTQKISKGNQDLESNSPTTLPSVRNLTPPKERNTNRLMGYYQTEGELPALKDGSKIVTETLENDRLSPHVKGIIRSSTPYHGQGTSEDSKQSVQEPTSPPRYAQYPDAIAALHVSDQRVASSNRVTNVRNGTNSKESSFPMAMDSCTSNPNKLLPKRNQHQANKKEKNSFMHDIRTRCRTCRERFRQNAEFQKLKMKEQQELGPIQKEAAPKEKNTLPKGKLLTVSVDDLESILSDEVLDFDDEEIGNPPKRKKPVRCKKGYSRKRLEELAQPRAGRKRKLLFSKQLIKKEADCLIESHSLPELTEKEKERLRMLQSKIRMFLAMMQDSLMPSKMVHIPQRDDIMKVDISHH